ncbi:DMT family transporter [Psychrobacter sp. I-STPA6b]|uniref:DMT family transporter n=1 Tax=Psychrobacter sp. I-STPA6b TaxID=2585718 RepID=UPI001D0CC94F|nr:DMT family transporter [Psychrobacter sp. I-STPA6b]
MKILPYVLLSLLAGAIIPLQLAIVNAFRDSTHASQIQATFYLYLGGTFASLLLAYLISGGIKPAMAANASWWMWTPGLLGSFYILFMFITAPKIGAGNTLLWVFLGQMYFALILNQTGWFGLEIKAIDPFKIAGLALVTIGGLVMIYGESRQ